MDNKVCARMLEMRSSTGPGNQEEEQGLAGLIHIAQNTQVCHTLTGSILLLLTSSEIQIHKVSDV